METTFAKFLVLAFFFKKIVFSRNGRTAWGKNSVSYLCGWGGGELFYISPLYELISDVSIRRKSLMCNTVARTEAV